MGNGGKNENVNESSAIFFQFDRIFVFEKDAILFNLAQKILFTFLIMQ